MSIQRTRNPKRRVTLTKISRSTSKRPGASSKLASAERSAFELEALQGFRTIFGSARAHDAEIRRAAGIPGSQLWALSEIFRSEGVTVNELSERMALHQTTASNLVNALVVRQLIRRVRDARDLRIVHLHVAAEGKRLLLRAPGPYAGLLPDALRRMESDQLLQLTRSLAVLVTVLHRTEENAAGEPLLGL